MKIYTVIFYLKAARDVWETVFHKQAAPNGGVMRTSVLGVFDYLNEEAVIKNTIDMCMVTHSDPRLVLFYFYLVIYYIVLYPNCFLLLRTCLYTCMS